VWWSSSRGNGPPVAASGAQAPRRLELPNVECGRQPLLLPIRQRSRNISIAEPELQIPPNAGGDHIVEKLCFASNWISPVTRFSHFAHCCNSIGRLERT